MPRTAILGAVLLAYTMVPAARADDAAVLPGESRTTAARLAEVRKKIDDKKYTEAIADLQAILESAGNDLVPVTPQHCVQARRLCHREVSKLPPEALREYRSRVEPQAKKWLDEAIPTRDVRLLRRVVEEAFCSRSGEMAIDLLGDLAFERGRFDEAIVWWRYLAPPLDANKEQGGEPALIYPDVQGDKAKLVAKQIVARFFAGEKEDAARELTAFQKEFPNAEGSLAGRKGKYADLLQAILTETPDLDKTWTTFGGDATRGLVLPAPPRWLERLAQTVKDGPTWQFNLETRAPIEQSPPAPPGKGEPNSVRASKLAFEPLICGHNVIVSDAEFVTAYDLRTGKKTDWFDVAKDTKLAALNLKLPTKPDLRYTLTAADDCLYVRLGAQSVFFPEEQEMNKDGKIASFLACLSLDPAAKNRVRWVTRPLVVAGKPEWEQRGAIFEGAPVVSSGLLYIAVTWFEGDRTVTAIQCYPAGTETLPQKRWQQTVCETRELKPKDQRVRHHLLTIAGPNVVYCSHSGVIVAVDALSGKTAWAVRYPSQPPTNADEPSLRDLTPCVYAAGRLYAAPADYAHLLCLDPLTGDLLWDRERIAATHLLGVGKGRLIFTTLAGLRAVNAADGSDTGGWFEPGGGGTRPPMGRGFLIGDVVVWPAVFDQEAKILAKGEGVFVRRQADGAPAEFVYAELRNVPAGNLVYSNGVLAVADRTTLSVFVPSAMQADEVPRMREPAPPAKGAREPAPRPSQTVAPRFDDTRKWSLPWERTEETRLAPGERLLALPGCDEGVLICDERGRATFHPRDATQKSWSVLLPFRPTTARIDGERLLLAGSDGLLAVKLHDGQKLWTIRRRGCSGFQFTDRRLFFLENEERLFAVDAATGETLWSKWAPGARLYQRPPLGHYYPQITLIATHLLVQPTPGRLWLLDAATGTILHEQTNRFEPWPRSPVLVDEATAAVVLDARTVALIDGTGKTKWKHVIDYATTLTGEAPQLVVDQENILMLTANNFGYTLQRLDRATGKEVWLHAPLLEAKTPLDSSGWSLDKSAVYYVEGRVLTARSLADGSILWRQALPEGCADWRTGRLGDAVLAYPADTGTRQFQFRWQMFSVQWELNHSPEVGVGRGLPVICCDAISGRMRQRLNLLAGPPRVRTRLGLLSRVAAPSRPDTSPQMLVTRNDLLIAIDSNLWRFTPARANER